MCSGSERKVASSTGVSMEGHNSHKQGDGFCKNISILLELSATDDLVSFRRAVEEEGYELDESSSWYGRRIGSKKMGFEERTPLMIAAMFGSKDVLTYILRTGVVDVNRACGSDGATALHCAAGGGSCQVLEIVKILVDASADINCVDANGSRPGDVIALCPNSSSKSRRKALQIILEGEVDETSCASNQVVDHEGGGNRQPVFLVPSVSIDGNGTEKKEYPVDPSLPDIKNGIYSTDEFRMYAFKIKPCSRAYSHDWTECPFVHPGENARRRDPRKYHYSCVPCPEFKKGSCSKADACEYAHGIFECWLHPAQYRTRLCKDEISCARRVCFFAHKPEELRPLYPSTGSAVPSPRSMSSHGASPFDMASLSPLALGSSSMLLPSTSTPPMTPTGVSSSPMGGGGAMWQNHLNIITPPPLQLPGSRLKTTLSARNAGLEAELLGLENQRRRQQLLEELAGLGSPSGWNNASLMSNGELGRLGNLVSPMSLDDVFGSMEPSVLSQSPKGMQMRQNMNQQLRSSYSSGISSPVRTLSPFGMDPAAVLNSRAAAFAKRSQSFIDRGAVNRLSGYSSPAPSPTVIPPHPSDWGQAPSHLSNWGSPNGKLDWGVQGEELNKLRKSASFGFRSIGNNTNFAPGANPMGSSFAGPDVPWVKSSVKDTPAVNSEQLEFDEELRQRRLHHLNSGGSETIPSWVEQYLEQEQMVA